MKLPDIKNDFPGWYQSVVRQAELIDDGPVRGTMVIRPYGYAIWENIQSILNEKIKALGVKNAYFPLFIPESFLQKEQKHIQGFSPELAVVTHAGGKVLNEPLIVRPTSETVVYHMFARWIKSWRDLPVKINQWANVVRWEMRTRPFLRTTEFLWQEGHTAHCTRQEAVDMAQKMLEIYANFAKNYLAIPVITGEKSSTERFAGAEHTFTFESMMQDGKALQMGTSHILSTTLSKAFNVQYQDKKGVFQSPYCTSWGITTRLIGAIIMVHGDKQGLVLPPRIAPYTVVIVPIIKQESEEAVLIMAANVQEMLQNAGIRVFLDNGEQKTPGEKFYEWELKGVPIRIEIGPRDVQTDSMVLINRAEQDKGLRKKVILQTEIVQSVEQLSDQIHEQLFARAKSYRDEHWHIAEKLSEFGTDLEQAGGFYQAGWCNNQECEAQLKQYKGTIRCMLQQNTHNVCFMCNKKSTGDVVIAKSY